MCYVEVSGFHISYAANFACTYGTDSTLRSFDACVVRAGLNGLRR